MKVIVFIFFVLMCLGQWLVPGFMIYQQEAVIADGTIYKFKTQPIDPTDPFRGSYITLYFESNFFDTSEQFESGQNLFLSFDTDDNGFALIRHASSTPPATGDYLAVSVQYQDSDGRTYINYPFNRFYLEESKAAGAERAYWDANRVDSNQVAYAEVRIKDGVSSLIDVKINDRSIVDLVREANAREGN